MTYLADTRNNIAYIVNHVQDGVKMGLRELIDRKAVFTHDEVVEFLNAREPRRQRTKESLLRYYQRTGRLLRVRRGLYVAVPTGATPETCPVDPYLLASKAAKDAVLAYHTALEFYGKAHTVFHHLYYLAHGQQRPWTFRDYHFHRAAFPKVLQRKRKENHGVHPAERAGEEIRVTSFERTLVDVLDRPELAGGYEEIWRSLESVEFFDLDRVIEYALLLDNATTVAKVGFFLEQHRESLMVEDKHLRPLLEHRPKRPHYLDRSRKKPTRFAADWNLVVPLDIFERSWQEVR